MSVGQPELQLLAMLTHLQVKNIPSADNINEDSVREVLEGAGLQVRSVAFDTVKILDRRVAYVRLQPPPLPWKITDKQETDVSKIAIAVVKRLKEADPPLQLGEDKLQFDTSHPQVQLFIGNITEEWSDDVSLREKMEEYGPVERCLVVHNHKGQTKVLSQPATHYRCGFCLIVLLLSLAILSYAPGRMSEVGDSCRDMHLLSTVYQMVL